jgi:phage shock protein PspC (stress-responsive transcriptional regulator)
VGCVLVGNYLEPPTMLTTITAALPLIVALWIVLRAHRPAHGKAALALHSDGRVISGLCVGIATYTGRSPRLIRALVLLALVVFGWKVAWLYVATQAVVPWAPGQRERVWSARMWRAMRRPGARHAVTV